MNSATTKIDEVNNPKGRAMREAIQKLISGYALYPSPTKGNEDSAWVGYHDGTYIRLSKFSTFFNVDLAFGGVYHAKTPNKYTIGEDGMFSASATYRTHSEATDPNRSGQAIPGNDLSGLCYRIGAVAAKSRSVVPEVKDQYIRTDDIVAEGLKRKEAIVNSDQGVDPNSQLQEFEEGWC